MKFFASFVALAAALASAHAKIMVQDNFLDAAAAADIEAQLPTPASSRFCDHVDLPSSLYQRLLAVMQPGDAPAAHNTRAPVRGEHGPVRAHKDKHADGMEAEGQAALLYLEGDGRMLFRHDATGVETAVDVKPGRFISWPNQEYTHTLEPGAAVRRMVGPMAFKDHAMQSIGDQQGFRWFIGQAYVKSLVVKTGNKGGWVKVILDFLVTEWPPSDDGRRLSDGDTAVPGELVLYCGLADEGDPSAICSVSASTQQANWDQEEVQFKSGRISPNTWTKTGNSKPVFEEKEDGTGAK